MFPENIRFAILLNDIYYTIDVPINSENESFEIPNIYTKATSATASGEILDLDPSGTKIEESDSEATYELNTKKP